MSKLSTRVEGSLLVRCWASSPPALPASIDPCRACTSTGTSPSSGAGASSAQRYSSRGSFIVNFSPRWVEHRPGGGHSRPHGRTATVAVSPPAGGRSQCSGTRSRSKQWIIIVRLVLSGREEIPSVTSSDMAPDRSTSQPGVDLPGSRHGGLEAAQDQLDQEQAHVTAVYTRLDELRAHTRRRLAEVR